MQQELGPSLTTNAFLRSSSGSSASSEGRQLYLKALDEHQQHWKQQQHKGLPLPVFIADKQLNELVEPRDRCVYPLVAVEFNSCCRQGGIASRCVWGVCCRVLDAKRSCSGAAGGLCSGEAGV